MVLKAAILKTPRRVIVGAAVVVGVIVLSSQNESDADRPVSPPAACSLKVTADTLNVRSGPGTQHPVVDVLRADAVVEAALVTEAGFRQLGPDRWAAEQYLDLVPGSNCG